eukprot:5712645-Karenia_brevis.AAC.1
MLADTQWGSGCFGGSTSVAHLYCRTMFHVARLHKMSLGILFVDVKTAFAALARRILFTSDENDEMWLRKLQSAGFDEQDIAWIYAHIQ